MDGYLKIKTKIDNKDVDKGVAELENKIKKLQTDNSELSKEENGLQKEIDNYEKLTQKADEYQQKIKELKSEKDAMFTANPSLAVTYDTPEYANIKSQIEAIKQKYAEATSEIDKQAPKIDKVYEKLSKVKAKQAENNAKISQFKQKIDQININRIQGDLNSVGKSIQSQISKIGKMALAVFGIRTAFNAVRMAVSTLSQYYPDISANINYIRYALASMLLPVIQKLISLAYTLLSYINAITSAWFGINLFSNASVKNFQKMQGSAGGTAKSVKEIKKSLQGFDEMNVLQDNSNSSSGGVGGGAIAPIVDLSGMQAEIPAWLKWIMENKDLIVGIIETITFSLIAMKMFGLDPITSLGIGITIKGILDTVKAIVDFIKDPTWENFIRILEGISEAAIGICIIIGMLTGNWIPLIISSIAFIVIEIIKHWDEIKDILGAVGQWIYDNILMPVLNFIIAVIETILNTILLFATIIGGIFTTLIGILCAPFQTLWDVVESVFNGAVNIAKGILKIFKGVFTGDMKTVFKGFQQMFKGVFESLWGIVKAPLNLIIRGINSLIKGANKIQFDVPNWVPGIGGQRWGFNIPQIPLLARGTIVSKPTQAIIGEAGAEAVVPLENNLEWLDILADKLADKLNTNGVNNIYLDSRLIQRQIAKRNQQLAFTTNS